MRPLSIIVAVGRNHAIGRRGQLPWAKPWTEDRAHFDQTTRGHAVIMGKRTYDETGAALADRINLVVSQHTRALPDANVLIAPSLNEALALAYARDPSPFVIGGAQLFLLAQPLVTRAYITEVPESPPDADTFFTFDARGFAIAEERRTASGLRFVTWQHNEV